MPHLLSEAEEALKPLFESGDIREECQEDEPVHEPQTEEENEEEEE